MSDVLMKKREMFRERMARRKANEEAREAIEATRVERIGHDDEREFEGEEEDEWDDDDDDVEDDDADDGEEMALIESAVIEIIASSHSAAQKEDWAEVLDCSSQLEEALSRAKVKVAACATAARVLLATGLKHASGFSDEPRVRSTLGCLMLIEWCVPTCPDAFRQAVASDRWVRKLVDLCRKDSTEQALVRTTVMQLMSNWKAWYGLQPACDGFEKACEMLDNEGFEIPPPARREDATAGSGEGLRAGVGGGASGPRRARPAAAAAAAARVHRAAALPRRGRDDRLVGQGVGRARDHARGREDDRVGAAQVRRGRVEAQRPRARRRRPGGDRLPRLAVAPLDAPRHQRGRRRGPVDAPRGEPVGVMQRCAAAQSIDDLPR